MLLFLNKINELESHGIDIINLNCVDHIYFWTNDKNEFVLQIYYNHKDGSYLDDDKCTFDYFYIADEERKKYVIEQLKNLGLKE